MISSFSDAKPDLLVSELLNRESTWSVAEILQNLQVLKLDANLRVMGVRRFIDACFYFSLARWADDGALERYGEALTSHEISPSDFVRILLESEERTSGGDITLPGPYHYKFLFDVSL